MTAQIGKGVVTKGNHLTLIPQALLDGGREVTPESCRLTASLEPQFVPAT